jgi:hypothetical protein
MRAEQQGAMGFDGKVDRDDILRAAEKFHPALKQKDLWKMYLPQDSTPDPGVCSNSQRGLRLRRQKQFDILRIVQDVQQDERERAFRTIVERERQKKQSNLKITRPIGVERYYRDQYKKQGREWNDGHRRHSDDQDIHEGTPQKRLSLPEASLPDVHCYCQQPDDEDIMVVCGGDACMFGLIHLRCSGLDELPASEGSFLCEYCMPEPLQRTTATGEGANSRETLMDYDEYGNDEENVESKLREGIEDIDLDSHGEASAQANLTNVGFTAVNKPIRSIYSLPSRPQVNEQRGCHNRRESD